MDTGTVTGKITAADGETAIPGATVGLAAENTGANLTSKTTSLREVRKTSHVIDPDGPTTTTDENGEYTLENVPSGEQTLGAKKGVFETTFSVNVEAGETVMSEDSSTTVQPSKPLGVVLGNYDSIEAIVDSLGYASNLDTLQTSDLADASTLNNYSIVFINCGSGGPYSDERVDAMRTYMSNGGTLYLSDLEQDYAEALFPGTVSFNNQTSTQQIKAEIESNDLRTFVGKDSVEIAYDLPSWERVVSISDTTSYPTPRVLLNGQPQELDSGSEPLAITYNTDPGRLVYTTFHNEAGATADQRAVLKYYVFLP